MAVVAHIHKLYILTLRVDLPSRFSETKLASLRRALRGYMSVVQAGLVQLFDELQKAVRQTREKYYDTSSLCSSFSVEPCDGYGAESHKRHINGILYDGETELLDGTLEKNTKEQNVFPRPKKDCRSVDRSFSDEDEIEFGPEEIVNDDTLSSSSLESSRDEQSQYVAQIETDIELLHEALRMGIYANKQLALAQDSIAEAEYAFF